MSHTVDGKILHHLKSQPPRVCGTLGTPGGARFHPSAVVPSVSATRVGHSAHHEHKFSELAFEDRDTPWWSGSLLDRDWGWVFRPA